MDAVLFFVGASNQASGSWGDEGVPVFRALLLTAFYVAITILAAFWIVTLERKQPKESHHAI